MTSGLAKAPGLRGCGVLLAAPLTAGQFKDAPDYWRTSEPSWRQLESNYREFGLRPDKQLKIFDQQKRGGADIRLTGSAADFQELIAARQIVFLLAHCEQQSEVIFWDQALFLDELVAMIPSTSTVVLYGAVCEAKGFKQKVKTRAPHAVVSAPGPNVSAKVSTSITAMNLVLTHIADGKTIGEALLLAQADLQP